MAHITCLQKTGPTCIKIRTIHHMKSAYTFFTFGCANFEIQIFNIVQLKIVTPDFFLKVGVTVDPPVFFMLFYFSCKQPLKTGKDRSVSLHEVLEVSAVNMVSSCRVVTYSQRLGFILLVGVGWGLEYPEKLWSEHYISCDGISPISGINVFVEIWDFFFFFFFLVWTLRPTPQWNRKCWGHIFNKLIYTIIKN